MAGPPHVHKIGKGLELFCFPLLWGGFFKSTYHAQVVWNHSYDSSDGMVLRVGKGKGRYLLRVGQTLKQLLSFHIQMLDTDS